MGPFMTAIDWLWVLHPALAVVIIYPLLGMVMRLAWQTRQRRVAKVKHPVTVGADHSGLGRGLAAARGRLRAGRAQPRSISYGGDPERERS